MANLSKISASIVITYMLAGSVYAEGIVTYDPTNIVQTTISAQQSITQTTQQLQQYQAQLQQLQNQIQNTTNPSTFSWNNANATINNVLATVNTLNTYKTQAGNMENYLNQFSNANQYQTNSCIGTGGCSSAQLQQLGTSQYTGSASQKIANDNMLQNINAQQQLLQSDASSLTILQQSAQSSTGQMQALQAANQLASNQAVQLMQIRALMIAQQTAEATRAETVVDREAQEQAAHDAFTQNQLTTSPAYNILDYTGTR
jgi:P-type conjugative transfer protein TrbJ